MKKMLIISLSVTLAFAAFSCTDNNFAGEEDNDGKVSYLNLKGVDINGCRKSKSGTVSEFQQTDTIGICLPDYHMGLQSLYASFNYYQWQTSVPVSLIATPTRLLAYYPYRQKEHANQIYEYVNIEHGSQTDYMYGYAINEFVSWKEPEALLLMEHALAMLQFKFAKNGYDGKGAIQRISVRNADGVKHMHSEGRMYLKTGKIEPPVKGYYKEACIMPENMVIPDSYTGEKEYARILVIPTSPVEKDGDLIFEFEIDGHIYTYPVVKGCSWQAGTKYTYEVEMVPIKKSLKSSAPESVRVILTRINERP